MDDGVRWSLFSGGKDSITTAHVLAARKHLAGIVFLDTGIRTDDILEHVRGISDRFGWGMKVLRTPFAYDDIVLRFGFPGPPQHNLYMNYLKGRQVRQLHRESPDIVLASGVRSKESNRRFRNARRVGMWEGVRIEAPIFDWPTERVWDYVRKYELPLSPSYENLHYSGDCLCGSFVHQGELLMLRMFYPQVFERIASLEDRCRASGVKRCQWGGTSTKPGTSHVTVENQMQLCFECEVK